MATRNVHLRIEGIDDYSPVEPRTKTAAPIEYKRDGMRNPGHEAGVISDAKRDVVDAPPDGNVAPPGWYLVFIVTGLRVPSIGEWVRLTPP